MAKNKAKPAPADKTDALDQRVSSAARAVAAHAPDVAVLELQMEPLWLRRAETIARARGLDVPELVLDLLRRAWVQLPSDKRGAP